MLNDIPEVEAKKSSRAKPTCMKCYIIGHKQKQCKNDDLNETVKSFGGL